MRRLNLESLEARRVLSNIVLDPSVTYQTMGHLVGSSDERTGVWEATAFAGELSDPGFENYIDPLLDLAVNELGIDRVRLEVRSGSENSQDYWSEWQAQGNPGPPSSEYAEWRSHRYATVNDDNDPMHINWSGFHFSELDNTIETIILPLQRKLSQIGKSLYINLNYVSFNTQVPEGLNYHHSRDPEEYAEFVLATYQHMEQKYGFVPDSWEVILEPENSGVGHPTNKWPKWTADYIGQVIAASGTRLEANGFTPRFVAPSNVSAGNTASWTEIIAQNPNALKYLHEVSYHLYGGNNIENRVAIAQVADKYGLATAQLEKLKATHYDLHNDLKYANNSSWAYYTFRDYILVDNGDPQNPVVSISPSARLMQQYMKYIEAGSVRIGANTDDVNFDPIGFVSPDGANVVVVNADRAGDFSITGLPPGTYRVTYATPAEQDVVLPDVVVKGKDLLSAFIPRAGVVTVHTRRAGDANDDGIFDSADLVKVFGSGEYEDNIPGNSTFDEGDWNGDGDFDSGDVLFAFETGTYQSDPGPASVAAAVDFVFKNDDLNRKKSAFVA